MSNWWRRTEQRRIDLANGTDADLVRDNRRRIRRSLALIGVAALLFWATRSLHAAGWVHTVITWLAIAALVAGFIGLSWAGEESKFLDRPAPEKPPRILKL